MSDFLRVALVVAGLLHFALLAAGLSIPRVLRWDEDLKKVDPFSRQLILVHGAFIVLVILCFGLITLVSADALVEGTLLGAALAGFIGLFWLGRLIVQCCYFNPGRWLNTPFRRLGYRSLTVVFLYLASVYLATAWLNLRGLGV